MARKATVCSSSLLLSTLLADGIFNVLRHVAQFASQLLFFFVFFFSPQEITKMNFLLLSFRRIRPLALVNTDPQRLPTDAHLVESSGFLAITFCIQDSNGFRCEELSVWTGGRGLLLFVLVLLVVGLPSWLSWYREL